MNMRREYRLIHGRYGCFVSGVRVALTDEVAILFEPNEQFLIRHGDPVDVELFHLRLQRIALLGTHAADELPDDTIANLVLIQGCFDCDDLNKVINERRVINDFYRRLQADARYRAAQVLAQAMAPRLPRRTLR